MESDAQTKSEVDRVCEGLFLRHNAQESDDNLAFVRNRLLKSEADLASLLELYGKVRQGLFVPDDETNPLCGLLKMSGVCKVEAGRLTVRNRIYSEVFNRAWVEQHLPDAELRRQKQAFRRGLLLAGGVASTVLIMMGALIALTVRNAQRADKKTKEATTNLRLANRKDLGGEGERTKVSCSTHSAQIERQKALSAKADADSQAQEAKRQQNRALDGRNLANRKAQEARVAAHQATLAHNAETAAKRVALNEANRAHEAANRADRISYMAIMNLLQFEWNTNNVRHVLELLEKTRNSPFRGFEWGYWYRLCHLNLMTFSRHTGVVFAAAYSPDGRRIRDGKR